MAHDREGYSNVTNRQTPWGVSEDSPMDEGSEPTAVDEARRGERRAAKGAKPGEGRLGRTEPVSTTEAGPTGPPNPAPKRRSFPSDAQPPI